MACPYPVEPWIGTSLCVGWARVAQADLTAFLGSTPPRESAPSPSRATKRKVRRKAERQARKRCRNRS